MALGRTDQGQVNPMDIWRLGEDRYALEPAHVEIPWWLVSTVQAPS